MEQHLNLAQYSQNFVLHIHPFCLAFNYWAQQGSYIIVHWSFSIHYLLVLASDYKTGSGGDDLIM